MWRDAAKWLSEFSEAVLTMLDTDGHPVSVRHSVREYDGATGELRVTIPEYVGAVPGRAVLLGHYHDEHLWQLRAVQVKGRLERRDNGWIFVTSGFTPPPRGQLRTMWRLATTMRRNADNYLHRRGMQRPSVNWSAVRELQRRAQRQ